ncbi:DUF2235 domain-containing protein [Erythrobacter sp. F6033]|uniref:DUF2235 domain-containing protein n=1 Tax=Erythrobacter sp. F6033 TaxID=2926401 RepID=UPI001FF329A5|nr:DUF2235 domain-containing protein [Erythrobacter sp. F6033]MCK0129275.1 DUF2235 domain-containing protein [Erythrobacter sp. F6033]
MTKNILIFADGTGQIGGMRPDQKLSNVYKMYRAMRPGPSSPIPTSRQVAYYDPGLGAGEQSGSTWGRVQRILEQAVGVGIEENMIDCYAKILSHYKSGDRIILIGFSRGAYTVRALANVMNLCGIPTQLPDGLPLPKSGPMLRAIAREAVNEVYSHGTGKPRGHEQYMPERETKGKRFRAKYGSQPEHGEDVQGNVQPHFIGVFDTVAALQNSAVTWIFRVTFWSLLMAAAAAFFWDWATLTKAILVGGVVGTAVFYIRTFLSQIRFYEPNPDHPLKWWNPTHWPALYRHTHRAYWDKKNYDRWLDGDVGFARHALSIDENRADFPRVKWASQSEVAKNADKEPRWLDQVWFAGCHSDVGGSYAEDESRLSDIALGWMVEELKACVPDIQINEGQLVRNPDPLGLQHEEASMLQFGPINIPWKVAPREVEEQFRLHPSVLNRLEATTAPHPNCTASYRPPQLAKHPQAAAFYCPDDQS